jgi:hypothetical protein
MKAIQKSTEEVIDITRLLTRMVLHFDSNETYTEEELNNISYLSECLEAAWNEIKDRKGKTQGGVFVKDEN